MKITRVDPLDDNAFAAWHAAYAAGGAAGRVNPPIWTLPELKVAFLDQNPDRSLDREAYSAIVDGEVVGALSIELPLHDNRQLAEFELHVPPQHRRKGVGSALFAELRRRVVELGRTSVVCPVIQPIGAEEVPGVAFAAKHGLTWRNTELRRLLELPVDSELLDSLMAEAEPHMAGYTIKAWQGRCPDEYAEQYAHLKSLLMTDAPTGEFTHEDEVWDVARLRAEEAIAEKQKREVLTAVAVAPDGSLAGHTQLAVPGAESGRTYQWDTLVLKSHRGHRLGVALKVTNLRILNADFKDRTTNETWNAEQNGPMNAVNEKLGFRALEQFQTWQIDEVTA